MLEGEIKKNAKKERQIDRLMWRREKKRENNLRWGENNKELIKWKEKS